MKCGGGSHSGGGGGGGYDDDVAIADTADYDVGIMKDRFKAIFLSFAVKKLK